MHAVEEYRRVLERKLADQSGLCADFQDNYSVLEQALDEGEWAVLALRELHSALPYAYAAVVASSTAGLYLIGDSHA